MKVAGKSEVKATSLSPTNDEIEDEMDDLDILHNSLKGKNSEEGLYTSNDEIDAEEVAQFHRTVQNLFEEEESLLNFHMSVIQVRLPVFTSIFK